MNVELFERLAKQVCLHFKDTCRGCPFNEFRKSVDDPSCDSARKTHRKDAEIILATWIGGEDFVKTLGETEQEKAPETRREILQAADRCVCGDRDQEYGGLEDSFALIARLWEPIIEARCVSPGADVNVDAVAVALLMAELKIARAATNETHLDSWVDLAGYAACGGELTENEEKTGIGEPLTLEQLREMDGEPVFYKSLVENKSGWAIIRIVKLQKEWIIELHGMLQKVAIGKDTYAETWLAYAYPPARIEMDAWEPCGECEPNNLIMGQNFCENCGRPLTEEARAELKKRLKEVKMWVTQQSILTQRSSRRLFWNIGDTSKSAREKR